MKIGQEFRAIAKFRSLKPFVFMVAVANVFDKVLEATTKPAGTDNTFNFMFGVAVRKLNCRRWSGVPVEGCIGGIGS
jgi:hypothetical protein